MEWYRSRAESKILRDKREKFIGAILLHDAVVRILRPVPASYSEGRIVKSPNRFGLNPVSEWSTPDHSPRPPRVRHARFVTPFSMPASDLDEQRSEPPPLVSVRSRAIARRRVGRYHPSVPSVGTVRQARRDAVRPANKHSIPGPEGDGYDGEGEWDGFSQ